MAIPTVNICVLINNSGYIFKVPSVRQVVVMVVVVVVVLAPKCQHRPSLSLNQVI